MPAKKTRLVRERRECRGRFASARVLCTNAEPQCRDGASERDAMEKLQYDLYYVKNHSLVFDFMVLAQTAEVVLLGKGAR